MKPVRKSKLIKMQSRLARKRDWSASGSLAGEARERERALRRFSI